MERESDELKRKIEFYRTLFEKNRKFGGPCIGNVAERLAQFEEILAQSGANPDAIESLHRAAGELGIEGQ